MKIVPKFLGFIKDGKVDLDDKESFGNWVKTLEGQKIEVVVQKWRKPKGKRYWRYFRGIVCEQLAAHLGYTNDEAYNAINYELLCLDKESKVKLIPSPKNFTDAELIEYVEHVKDWIAVEFKFRVDDIDGSTPSYMDD